MSKPQNTDAAELAQSLIIHTSTSIEDEVINKQWFTIAVGARRGGRIMNVEVRGNIKTAVNNSQFLRQNNML